MIPNNSSQRKHKHYHPKPRANSIQEARRARKKNLTNTSMKGGYTARMTLQMSTSQI